MKNFTKKSFTVEIKNHIKSFVLITSVFLLFGVLTKAQSPTFFSSGHYANPNNWTQGSAVAMGTIVGTNIHTTTPNGTGNQYFRFYSATSGGTNYSPNGTADILLTSGVASALQVEGGSGKAYALNIANASDNIVFKTDGNGSPGSARVVAFEVQGAVQTVSTVTQVPASGAVIGGLPVKVSATLSGSLPVGQGVYLRYTNDGYATSTVVAMSGTSTSYTATIPGSNNIASTPCSYYVFTSGSGLSIAGGDADLYTFNLNANGGGNYLFTPSAATVIKSNGTGGGTWNVGASWQGGNAPALGDNVEILSGDNITITNSFTQSGNVIVDAGGTLTLNPGGTTTVTLNGTNLISGNYVQTTGTLAGNNGGTTFFGNITLTAGVMNNQVWYTPSSTLIYNGISSTTTIWNAGVSIPALSIPYNVTINKTTTLPTLGNYTCLGTLNIVSTFTLNTTNANLTVGNLSGSGTYLANGNQTFTVGTANGNTTFSGAYNAGAVNNFTKQGTGTLILSGASNWTGPTAIQNGAVSLSTLNTQIGSGTSNLGSPISTAGNGTISLGSTTTTGGLIFTGATLTSDRVINLAGTTGGGYIQADGTGPLTLTGTNTATGGGSKTLTLTGTNTGNNKISGAIVDNSGANKTSVVKSGAGTWILSGTNTYTGTTTINNGILLINGTTNSGSAVTVATGATLGGNGTAAGTVALTGIVAPGSAASTVGALNTGAFTLNDAAQYSVDITNVAGTPGTNWDLLNSSGAITVSASSGAPVVIMLTGNPAGFIATNSYTWKIAGGTSIGSFAANKFTVNTTAFGPAFTGTFTVTNTGNDINLVYTAGPLPVKITSINTLQQQQDIAVVWKTENAVNIKLYEVERSEDGIVFYKVNTTNADNTTTYNWIDVKPGDGNYYYRIKSIDQDGSFEYSKIVKITIGRLIHAITAYPNPVKNNLIQLQMDNMPTGAYEIRLLNTVGQVVLKDKINHANTSGVETIRLNKTMANGIYQLEVTGAINYTAKLIFKK